MPLVSDSIPSMNNGVSQQPPSLRERTQCELQENAYSNVTTGLTKRPPTRHLQKIASASWSNAFIHNIKRDAKNIYTLILPSDGLPLVYNALTGQEQTVHYTKNEIHDTVGAAVHTAAGNPVVHTITITHAQLTLTSNSVIINNVGSGANDLALLNGIQTITVINDTSFSYTVASAPTNALTAGTFTETLATPTTHYLKQANADASFAATTIADYTYIVNKTKGVAKFATQEPAARPFEAMAYIKVGSYGTDYTLKIDASSLKYSTIASAIPNKSVTEFATSTALIASGLLADTGATASGTVIKTGLNEPTTSVTTVEVNTTNPGAGSDTTVDNIRTIITVSSSTSGQITTYTKTTTVITTPAADTTRNEILTATVGGVTLWREKGGSVIYMTSSSPFEASIHDSRGDIYTQLYKESTPSFSDLPPKGVTGHSEGMVIKIIGNNEKSQDDYYVKMEKTAGGSWVYKETVAHGIINGWDVNTMPHRVIRNTDDSFSVQTVPWEDRASGDEATNPFVSILGNTINDIFFHQNRLGLLSGENVLFSESGRFFSLFQNSVLNLVDTDAIDVAASSNVVNILKYAVPFAESLIIFSENAQFILKTQTFLSPLTVSIDITTQYEASLQTKPTSAGRFVFFPTNEGSHSGILEYFVDSSAVKTNDATSITSHIPRYLQGNVSLMKASSNASLMILKTDATGEGNKVYIYSYNWQGAKKLQSSWGQWVFNSSDVILYFDFVDRLIIFLIQRGSDVYLESITLGKDESESDVPALSTDPQIFGYPVYLDRRVRLISIAEVNTFTADNYTPPAGHIFVKRGIIKTVMQLTSEDGVDAISPTNPVYAGVPYTFKYQFTRILYRNYLNSVILDGRLQIRYMSINYEASGYFKVVIAPIHILRDSQTYTMTASRLGSTQTSTNVNTIISGIFRFPVHSDSGDATITLESDSFLPCVFQNATWEGTHYLRSRRVSGNPFRAPQGA